MKEKLHSKLPKNQSFVKPTFTEELEPKEKVPAWLQQKKAAQDKKKQAEEKPKATVDIGPYSIKFDKCKNPDQVTPQFISLTM